MAISGITAANLVSIPVDPLGTNYTSYSWAGLVNFSQTYTVARQTLFARQNGTTGSSVPGSLIWNTASKLVFDDYYPSLGDLTTGSAVNLVGWHHVAAVRSTSNPTRAIYVDGVVVATQNNSEAYTGSTPNIIRIGHYMTGATVAEPAIYAKFFDIRLYSVPLTAIQVAEIYARKGMDTIFGPSLVLRTCILNGYVGASLSGAVVYDHSQYGNHGGTVGAPIAVADPYSTVKPPLMIV